MFWGRLAHNKYILEQDALMALHGVNAGRARKELCEATRKFKDGDRVVVTGYVIGASRFEMDSKAHKGIVISAYIHSSGLGITYWVQPATATWEYHKGKNRITCSEKQLNRQK